ncbi:HK97 family phage prohead protease [uncultured Paracoccus sp.]|uniref:phage major capsid protein n=1 Tax=uncultured Paracoccus sp. TaxID=189685 RepID=UPI0025CE45CE|nr:HK97 family phage prohead protease [uncultured Paracoccus sp.]
MSKRFTGDPSKASFIKRGITADPAKAVRTRQPERVPTDTTQGDCFTRTMPRAGDLDEDSRTFRAVVATSTPLARRDAKGPFLEILDPAGLEFNAGDDLPLLTDHRQAARETVGRASGIVIDGPSVSATLRLGMADDIEPIFQRVKDGVIRHVSAGYAVQQWAETRNPDGTRVKTATRWRLLEISLVPVPADRNAIIHRNAEMPFDLETRTALIETLRSACNLTAEWGEDLTAEAVSDDEVRESAREAMSQRSAPRIRVTRSHDDPAQIQTRAADALAYRMGGIAELPEGSREFASMSLMDHARDSLQRAGVSVRGMSPDELIHRSLTTSDFPLVVSNAAGKSVAQAYQIAESPLKVLFRKRSLSDFKTSTAIRLGGLGMLEELTESGEITATSRGEEGEPLQLRTFARRLDLTRRLIVNDDLGLFGDVSRALGEAAAATESQLMFEQLTGGNTLSDGLGLFDVARENTGTYAVEELVAALSSARMILRGQRNLDGVTPIQATPRYIVAGPEMETALEKMLGVITPPDVDSFNPFASKLQLLIDPRIEGDSFYVVADPAQCAVFNLAHLASAAGPQIQRQEKWDTLGVSFRCFMDVGAGFAGWRGIVKMDVV